MVSTEIIIGVDKKHLVAELNFLAMRIKANCDHIVNGIKNDRLKKEQSCAIKKS